MKVYVVEREALIHNIQAIRRFAGPIPIWGVLKGNGYGIGVVPFSKILHENGIDRFAVTEIKEVEQLRGQFPDAPILMLRSTADPAEINELLDLNVAEVHLCIDTGMGRFGFQPEDTDKIISVYEYMKNLVISGIFTHFHSAFCNEKATRAQFEAFNGLIERLNAAGYETGMAHCCNSHAFVRHPEMHMDAVRIGSAFLGRLSFKERLGLRRVGYAECTVDEVREIPKGQTIGYGAGYKAKSQMRVAVIGLGWYNGFTAERENDLYRRRDCLRNILKNLKYLFIPRRIIVEVNGKKCRVLGHVGMVHAVVDVNGIDCSIGDRVTAQVNPLYLKGLKVQYR